MDIRLTAGSYKSITEFEWRDVPTLAVVTGPNGSGKTQMLELIAGGVGAQPTPEDITNGRYMNIQPFTAQVSVSPRPDSTDVVFLRSRDWRDSESSANLNSVAQTVAGIWNDRNSPLPSRTWNRLWETIEKQTGLRRSEISETQFHDTLPPNFLLLSDGLFSGFQISALFVSYLHAIDVVSERDGISWEAAKSQFEPLPWRVFDDILESAGLRYRVAEPVKSQQKRFQVTSVNYAFSLFDVDTKDKILPTDLSSGERVMLRVALWFLSFSQQHSEEQHPPRERLLLLDEPDAHLHPAMTKSFFRVVREELVERHGIRVIMTTHSPSTAALTDDSSLYVMSRKSPRIRRASSRWKAISELTAGFVAVGTQGKCAFVEGARDRDFFQAVQEMLADGSAGTTALDMQRGITFIDASNAHPGQGTGTPSGGRNNVLKWVKTISSTQIAGIVDHDNQSLDIERIHVLSRHSLECYLLDPLFFFALLLEHGKAPKIPALNLGPRDARRLLKRSAEEQQMMVDITLQEIRAASNSTAIDPGTASVEYFRGQKLSLPNWFLNSSAKPLFEPLRKKFGIPISHTEIIRQYRLMEIVPSDLVAILRAVQGA